MVNFDTTKEDREIIYKIAKKASKMARSLDFEYDVLTAQMDVTACHVNGNPLKLKELFEADDFNFSHDVFGIRRHINRETGELMDFFSPRYSV